MSPAPKLAEHALHGALAPEREQAKWAALREAFGFDAFRAGQEGIIDAILQGRSVLAVMPTGAGKSLCYQVPALALGGLTIVVSPLVALMNDQVAALRLAGVAADAIHSGQDREVNVEAWRRAARGDTRLLYMAPERLVTPRMLEAMERLPVSLFAIDEAHCISQWGPAFRPEYAELACLKDRFPNTPIAALTATADEETRADISDKLFYGDHATVVQGFDRPNIRLEATPKSGWKDQLAELVEPHRGEAGIVYCLSRKRTEEVAEILRAEGHDCVPYHAGLDPQTREERQNRFVTEDGLIVAATIAFGMGIDKADVRFVVHVDLPASLEAYYQEIGRAGRDGGPATAHMLYGANDMRMRRQFIDSEEGDDESKWRNRARLDALIGFAEATSCRRQALLRYFGEETEPCNNCDACTDPATTVDGTDEAQLVLATVMDTGQRYGQAHIVDILTGTATEKVTRAKHDDLATFGEGGRLSKSQWRGLVRQMVSGGVLEVDLGGYQSLMLAPRGEALAAGNGEFRYRPEEPKSRRRRAREAGAATSGRRDATTGRGAGRPVGGLTGSLATRGTARERVEAAAAELSGRDGDLLHRLKELRLTLAKERGAPAYVIFSDKTLIELAALRPSGLAEMGTVKGVGRAKLEAFGEAFLQVIAEG